MQAPPRQPADVIKATHYPTPPSVPAAAAAAAAMHAEAQHQKHGYSATSAAHGSSSPHSISPSTSHAPSPTGVFKHEQQGSCMLFGIMMEA